MEWSILDLQLQKNTWQAQIHSLLYELGIPAKYTGFHYLAYALELTVQEPERLCLVTKWVYPDVAKQFGTNWHVVERSMRNVIAISWSKRSDLITLMAQEDLQKRPCISYFLSIATKYLLQTAAA